MKMNVGTRERLQHLGTALCVYCGKRIIAVCLVPFCWACINNRAPRWTGRGGVVPTKNQQVYK
jgi:hypothetical protein